MKKFLVFNLLLVLLSGSNVAAEDLEKIKREIVYPVVRVRVGRTGGSGTVIWSGLINKKRNQYATYILTNHHVIDGAISLVKKWNPHKRRYEYEELRKNVTVDFFIYENDIVTGKISADSTIVTYSKRYDLGLLRLKSAKKVKYVAKMPTKEQSKKIKLLIRVYAVGCSLGHEPVVTSGRIVSFSKKIRYQPYWMSTAQIIFGNSGGAIFSHGDHLGNHLFLGVPAAVSVYKYAFSASVVSHMGFFVPIYTVKRWLKMINYHFIYDKTTSYAKCLKTRLKLKKKSAPSSYYEEEEDEEKDREEENNKNHNEKKKKAIRKKNKKKIK